MKLLPRWYVINDRVLEEMEIPGGSLRAGECERRFRILWFWKVELDKITYFYIAHGLVCPIIYVNCEGDGIIITLRGRFEHEL